LTKSLEKFLKQLVNLGKSEKYEDYKVQIDKQGDFISLSEEMKQKAFSEAIVMLKE
jgi:hypothetical protein